jgi:cytochrome oxidase Cu insertion factor (SCO1/SenC/PrrC family)
MNNVRRRKRAAPFARAALIVAVVVWTVASPALAHKFGGPNDPCERKLGASLIHITLYQPQFDPDAEYCDEIPREGNTVFVLDTMGDDLRRTPIGLRIFALAGDGSESRQLLVAMAPSIYRRGVVDTQVNFSEGRRYVAQVSIATQSGARPVEYAFPIRVRAWYRALVMPLLMVLGVLALVTISVVRPRRFAGPRRIDRHRSTLMRLAVAALAFWIVAGCRTASRAPAALPAVQLVDDRGNLVALDSLKGKVVLLDFVHIGCPGVCDNLVNKFGQIADAIRPELGSRVELVTITNDPAHDRPEQLLKLARGMQADMRGWLFLTGSANDVDRVITAFGVDNRRLPDGSPNHITRVFMLGPDLRQQREYHGMAMNSRSVASEIMNQVQGGGA